MSGYIRLINGGVMIAVFTIAIIMFAANFAVDNDSAISIADDGRYNTLNSTLRANLTDYSEESKTSQNMFFATTLESGDEHSSTGAQFKIGPLTAIGMGLTSFSTAFSIVFGPQFSWLAITFATLLTFILGYFTIKAWLGRSPE